MPRVSLTSPVADIPCSDDVNVDDDETLNVIVDVNVAVAHEVCRGVPTSGLQLPRRAHQ